MTYLMAPMHSLVDGLRTKNKCHQKEGIPKGKHSTFHTSTNHNVYDWSRGAHIDHFRDFAPNLEKYKVMQYYFPM
jgi:hypothetical protein